MSSFLSRYKLSIQTVALVLMMIATVPVYLGLQGGSDSLAWFGLALAALGMAVGLWAS